MNDYSYQEEKSFDEYFDEYGKSLWLQKWPNELTDDKICTVLRWEYVLTIINEKSMLFEIVTNIWLHTSNVISWNNVQMIIKESLTEFKLWMKLEKRIANQRDAFCLLCFNMLI